MHCKSVTLDINKKNRSVLEDIVNQLNLNDRYLVCQYLKGKKMDEHDYERIKQLELSMNMETTDWWNSGYSQERAYRQFLCSTIIMNYDIYKQDMQKLLKRAVTDDELCNRHKIANEVYEKYNEWRKELKIAN